MDNAAAQVMQTRILPLLNAHPAWQLQIQAFARTPDRDSITSRSLSLSRALSVRTWLMQKGIPARRLILRALGMDNPPGTAAEAPSDRIDFVFFDPEGGAIANPRKLP